MNNILVLQRIIGETEVGLPIENCRKEECLIGNLMTDAIADYANREYNISNAIVLYNVDSILASIAGRSM